MPDLVPWLIGLALVTLMGFLYWVERRYPGPSKPREQPFLLTYCAWCVHRDSDDCTHPGSQVYPGECGPVRSGEVRCRLRVMDGTNEVVWVGALRDWANGGVWPNRIIESEVMYRPKTVKLCVRFSRFS